MKFFILALMLHGLLFLKLYIPRSEFKENIPKKHNVVIKFQEIKTSIPATISTEEVSKTVKTPIKKEIVKEKVLPKKNVEKKVSKVNKQTKNIIKKQPKKIVKNDIREEKSINIENNSDLSSQIPDINSILQDNKDGTYTALSNSGIKYKILKEIEPIYPKQAENINYRKKVIVKAKFMVNENGEVENIFIVQSHKKLGFDDAVISALKKWKFSPIYYNNKIIKVYFQKEFVFESKR